MKNGKQDRNQPVKEARWERPTLKYVGNVADIFLFPGAGKVSTANYDSGDTPYKPKGQEH